MKQGRWKTWRWIIFAVCALIVLFLLQQFLFNRKVLRQALASEAYKDGNYAKAEEIWNKSLDPGDGDPLPESSLGKAQYKKGDFKGSLESQSEAVKENENVSQHHYDRGNALYRLDDLDEAENSYRSAMLADPEDQDAKSNYELVLRRQGYVPPPPPEEENPPEQDQKQGSKGEEQPSDEDSQSAAEREKYRNQLDALDQQESRDRQALKPQPRRRNPEKWW